MLERNKSRKYKKKTELFSSVLLHQEEFSLIRKEHKALKPQIMSKAPKLLETLRFSSCHSTSAMRTL